MIARLIGGMVFPLVMLGSIRATPPQLDLGPKASFGLFQPRVTIEVFADADGQQSLGPSSANSFLLDTGATSTLVFSSASQELKQAGYVVEGTFEETGVSGVETFDVSAPYRLEYAGTSGPREFISDVRLLSTDTGSIDPTGLLSLHGIVGMQAMEGRVTTLDNRSTDGAPPLSMGLSFSPDLPFSDTHRFSIPLQELAFPLEGEGPLPSASSLPTLNVISRVGGQTRSDPLVLDSGAQMTIISEAMAFDLGLDANGDGDLRDDAESLLPIGGIGGTVQAPVLTLDELRVPTHQGFELAWQDAQVIVQDIDPQISGVFGADMLTGDGGLNLGFLGGGDSGLGDLLGDVLGGGGLGDLFGDLLGDGGLEDLFDLLGNNGLGDLFGDLLGDLGGVFGSFPLESHFDRVHFDFRGFPEAVGAPVAGGALVLDVNDAINARILNGDGRFDARDIDDLTIAMDTSQSAFDLDADGIVSFADRELLIDKIFQTVPGDADLDQDVDFADFLTLSAGFDADGGWSDGDFDGNGRIEFADFLALSAHFGPVAAASPVPEPTGGAMLFSLLVLRGRVLRGRNKTQRRPSVRP